MRPSLPAAPGPGREVHRGERTAESWERATPKRTAAKGLPGTAARPPARELRAPDHRSKAGGRRWGSGGVNRWVGEPVFREGRPNSLRPDKLQPHPGSQPPRLPENISASLQPRRRHPTGPRSPPPSPPACPRLLQLLP